MPLGLKHFISDRPSPKDIETAQKALSKVTSLLASEKYDLVDESLNAIHLGLISSSNLIATLKKRAKHVRIVLADRRLPDDIRDYADLVTKMRLIKHSFENEIKERHRILTSHIYWAV